MKALVYARVSTGEQGRSGLGLEAQLQKCRELSSKEGFEVVAELSEVRSGKSVKARPVLVEALARLKAGEAEVLVVAKLDRLSRSLLDFSTLLARSEREGWALVVGDLGLSTASPVGRLQAQIVASVAEFERERIRERCREASKAKKDRGERVGALPKTAPEVVALVVELRGQGFSFAAAAAELNSRGVKPVRGREFYGSSVRALCLSEQGRRAQAA